MTGRLSSIYTLPAGKLTGKKRLIANMPVTLLISFRKAVLQVGADNSGTSIAHGSGPNHKVYLSTPRVEHLPSIQCEMRHCPRQYICAFLDIGPARQLVRGVADTSN